jgi:methionine-rich copper-binding protein CopC
VVIFLLFSILNISTLKAATSLGSGSGSNNKLIGGDLTDPEDNGVDGSDTNWNWTSIVASEENYWTSEGAYNVFDNKVDGGDAKWCCGGAPVWVYVQFSQTYVLSHFTITSGNDVPNRDPDIWRIQGSNDGTNWTDIFLYNNDGVSPFSARHETIRYDGSGTDFSTPAAYSYFRYYVNSTITNGAHQINELEFFGNPDSTAPTLSSSTPADNATGVLESANIVLNFSESVDVEIGNITIKKTSDDSTVETIDVRGGLVTGTDTSQITINPSVTLDSSTEYYVLIDATAFDDSSSNSYAGISSTTALSFTTGDNESPTLSSSFPVDNATDVARDANIILNFSESVDVESGNITIKKTSDDSTVETINVTSGQVTGTGASQITVNPSSDLFGGFEYYVLIDATAFDDSAGNSYAGITSTTALSFTVVDMQDPTTNKDVVGSIDSQSNISKNYAQQSINVVSGRLKYLRENFSNSNLSSKNIQLDFFGNTMINSLSEAIQVANKSSKIPTPKEWSSWSEGLIVLSKTGDNGNSSSFEVDTRSAAVGFDKKLNEKKLQPYLLI